MTLGLTKQAKYSLKAKPWSLFSHHRNLSGLGETQIGSKTGLGKLASTTKKQKTTRKTLSPSRTPYGLQIWRRWMRKWPWGTTLCRTHWHWGVLTVLQIPPSESWGTWKLKRWEKREARRDKKWEEGGEGGGLPPNGDLGFLLERERGAWQTALVLVKWKLSCTMVVNCYLLLSSNKYCLLIFRVVK